MTGQDTAVGFLSDVVSARPPGEMPESPEERRSIIDLLHLHRLTGLAVAEARERGDKTSWMEPGRGLQERYLRTALHTTLVLESARRASGLLAEAGIPSLYLKGVALLESGAYSDPGARDLEDADLLVARGQADRAVRVLSSAGYVPWMEWDERRCESLPAFSFTDSKAPPGIDVTLDLHWQVPYASLRTGAECAAGAIWADADVELHMPAVETHFLLIAEHFLKHLRVVTHARGLADLVRLLPRLGDPHPMVALARRRRTLTGLRLLLGFLRDSLGVRVPDPLAREAEIDARAPRRAARLLDANRLLGSKLPVAEGPVSGLLAHWSLAGPPWRIVQDAWQVLAPPAGWLESRYPETNRNRRRAKYLGEVGRWLRGQGPSPLSPNQEFRR
jgi:hypothetical protein